jgi:hypothetical protein
VVDEQLLVSARKELQHAAAMLLHFRKTPLPHRRTSINALKRIEKFGTPLLRTLVLEEHSLSIVLSDLFDNDPHSNIELAHLRRSSLLKIELYSLLMNVKKAMDWVNRPDYAGPPRGQTNVDLYRNLCWSKAAHEYEVLTGRRVGASHKPSVETQGPARGPFVRFIQALMREIPGEKVPTGDEVRWFVRNYQKERLRA